MIKTRICQIFIFSQQQHTFLKQFKAVNLTMSLQKSISHFSLNHRHWLRSLRGSMSCFSLAHISNWSREWSTWKSISHSPLAIYSTDLEEGHYDIEKGHHEEGRQRYFKHLMHCPWKRSAYRSMLMFPLATKCWPWERSRWKSMSLYSLEIKAFGTDSSVYQQKK